MRSFGIEVCLTILAKKNQEPRTKNQDEDPRPTGVSRAGKNQDEDPTSKEEREKKQSEEAARE